MAIDIGLASREFTVAYRYILSDELLLTLVYAVVKENFVPMKGFLKELRTKFGIVIDEASAMEYAGDIEIETKDLDFYITSQTAVIMFKILILSRNQSKETYD